MRVSLTYDIKSSTVLHLVYPVRSLVLLPLTKIYQLLANIIVLTTDEIVIFLLHLLKLGVETGESCFVGCCLWKGVDKRLEWCCCSFGKEGGKEGN